jgi:hypothetical protein
MMRSAATTLSFTICVLSALSISVEAQAYRSVWSSAMLESGVDASSLGPAGRGFLEFSVNGGENGVYGGGVGLVGGSLRAIFGQGYRHRTFGVGYSRVMISRPVGSIGTLATGLDISAAYNTYGSTGVAPRAALLTIPLSLRWGSPSHVSFAPYVGPYGQIGSDRLYRLRSCDPTALCGYDLVGLQSARGAGLATGFDLTVWRLGFDVGYRRDLTNRYPFNFYKLEAGIRLRW